MRKRPPLPPNLWTSESLEMIPRPRVFFDEKEWGEIRKSGLDALDKVRTIFEEHDSRSYIPAQQESQTVDEQKQDQLNQKEDEALNSVESPSLYSFWHDIGPTLSAILAVEEIGQQLLKLSHHAAVSSTDDLDPDREIISKDFTSELTPLPKNITAHASLKQRSNSSSFGFQGKDQERWLQLNAERGSIIGAYGASRYLTWSQLIAAKTITPPSIIDPPPEAQREVGARARQKRRKMRIARVKAHYHKKLQTHS